MHNEIVEILEVLGIDLAWQEYSGNSNEYIIFSIYNDEDANYFDDESLTEIYYINITYWYESKKNINKWKEIKKLMKSKGFIYDDGKDLKDKNLYGKSMDFIIQKETV